MSEYGTASTIDEMNRLKLEISRLQSALDESNKKLSAALDDVAKWKRATTDATEWKTRYSAEASAHMEVIEKFIDTLADR